MMPIGTKSVPVGRRPTHTTLDFDAETDSACIQQLHRAELVVSRNLVAGKKVLDVGCGSGYTCQYFVQRGGANRVTGVDVDQTLIQTNTSTNDDDRIDFVYADPDVALPFSDESFEVVTCFEVLEHVRFHVQRRIVREAARLVASSGVCVFSTPHQPVYSPDGLSRNPDHIREINREEFKDLLDESFESVELLGQGFSSQERLNAHLRSHLLAHHPAVRGVLWATRGLPAKLMRRSCVPKPYSQAKNSYTITPEIDEQSLVMLAICHLPR